MSMRSSHLNPDILVVDHQMPKMTGLEVLAVLRDQAVRTRSVVLTGTLEDARVMEAIQLGARGVIPKDLAARNLLQWSERLRRAALGSSTNCFGAPWRISRARPHGAAHAREREIVQRVVEGSRNKEIARQMQISEGTVKMHLHNVYAKLNVGSRTELAVLANRLGF